MSIEIKPIVVIRYRSEGLVGRSGENIQMYELNKHFAERFFDYHTFCYPTNIEELFEFDVFHPKDFTPIQYEELKSLINNAIDQTKTKP